PAALQSKKRASSKAVATFFAPSLSAWGAGMAMGRGRKLAPEISMIGAWASAPNGQARRQRTRVRITRAPRGSGAELQHHSVLLQRITEMGGGGRDRGSGLNAAKAPGAEEAVPGARASRARTSWPGGEAEVAGGTGEPGPIQLSGGGDEDRHLGHQADPLRVGNGLGDVVEAFDLCLEPGVVRLALRLGGIALRVAFRRSGQLGGLLELV